jgi:hypothetical protein
MPGSWHRASAAQPAGPQVSRRPRRTSACASRGEELTMDTHSNRCELSGRLPGQPPLRPHDPVGRLRGRGPDAHGSHGGGRADCHGVDTCRPKSPAEQFTVDLCASETITETEERRATGHHAHQPVGHPCCLARCLPVRAMTCHRLAGGFPLRSLTRSPDRPAVRLARRGSRLRRAGASE